MTAASNSARFSFSECYGSKACHIVDSILLVLVTLLILVSPLPFGSVGYSSILVIELTAALCFGLWTIKLFFLADRKQIELFRNSYHQQKSFRSLLGFPIKNTRLEIILLSFLILILFQTIPIPGGFARLISPHGAKLYESAFRAAGVSAFFHPVSLNVFTTISKFLLYGAYFMIFLVAVNTLSKRWHYILIISAVVASGLFQSVYGVYELLSGHQQIFGYKKKYFLNCATGTFVNRNHYAAYVGASLPLLISVFAAQIDRARNAARSAVPDFGFGSFKGVVILLLFSSIVMVGAGVFYSLSLSGISAALIACALFGLFYARMQKIRAAYWLLLVAIIFVIGISLRSTEIQKRISGLPGEILSERSRFMAWKDTLRVFLRYPLTGTGAGTFAETFPVYRTFGTTTTYSETHNEYLQLLSETGVFVGVLFAFVGAVLFSKFKQLFSSGVSPFVITQLGAFFAFMVLCMHNLFDFSFQIPAVSVAGTVFLALFCNTHEIRSQLKS